MQIMKAGAVAIGALATVAAMGAPAAAAANHAPSGLSLDKAQAMRSIGAQFLGRGGWDAPWDIDPQATISELSGSVTNTNAFQGCGSTVTNAVGAATSTGSPNTVLGDCDNGNSEVTQSYNYPVTGILDDSVTTILTNQACGSTASFAVGIATALQSPNTVIGDCDNGNVEIGVEEDEDEDKDSYKDGHKDSYKDWHEESATLEVAKAVALRKGHIATTKAAPVRAASDAYYYATAAAQAAPVAQQAKDGWGGYDYTAPAGHKAAQQDRDGWGGYDYKAPDGHKSAPVRAGWDSYGHSAKAAPQASRDSWDSYGHSAKAAPAATPVRDSWGGYDHSAKAAGRSALAVQRSDDDDEGGWTAPWDVDAFGLVSTQSGSALLTATNQACGSTAVFDVGGAIATGSPNTVLGECDNANVDIKKLGPKAAATISDNSSVNLLPWQLCGSTGASGVGAAVALQSPNTVFGGCSNANTEIS